MISLTPEQKLGPYRLLERIATGGMAEVWRAVKEDRGQAIPCALKLIAPEHAADRRFEAMFREESRLAVDLKHPNLILARSRGVADNHLYLEMEFVEGKDLAQLLSQSRRPLAPVHALYVCGELLKALRFLHTSAETGFPQPIIHRDISPQNVLLSYDGAVKLADLGIAKDLGSPNKTETGLLKGKLRYMSPEHLRGGDLDARSDLFMLGATVFEALTGKPCFEAAEPRNKPLSLRKLNASIPAEVERWLVKLLAVDPADRYKSAAEALRELEKLKLYILRNPNVLGQYVRNWFERGGTEAYFVAPELKAPATPGSALGTRALLLVAAGAALLILFVGLALRHCGRVTPLPPLSDMALARDLGFRDLAGPGPVDGSLPDMTTSRPRPVPPPIKVTPGPHPPPTPKPKPKPKDRYVPIEEWPPEIAKQIESQTKQKPSSYDAVASLIKIAEEHLQVPTPQWGPRKKRNAPALRMFPPRSVTCRLLKPALVVLSEEHKHWNKPINTLIPKIQTLIPKLRAQLAPEDQQKEGSPDGIRCE